MKEKYQLVILVIASTCKSIYMDYINIYWKKIIQYIKKKNLSIKVILLFNKNKDSIDIDSDDYLEFNYEENFIPGILKKTVDALEYVNKNYDYKHVLRTNLSSFFIIKNLLKKSNVLKNKKLYAGVENIYTRMKSRPRFLNGAQIWLSRDTVGLILKKKDKLNYNIIDDVSLGIFFSRNNIKRTKTIRYCYFLEDKGKKSWQRMNIINKHYHVRLKSFVKNRNNEINILKILCKKFNI